MNEEGMGRDCFGFLPFKWTIEFDGGKISPLPDFDEAAACVDKYVNEDGFLYPPIEHRAEVDPISSNPLKDVPRTERPAHLHRIPSSHELFLFASGTSEDIRKGPGSFLIHLLSYLFGVRLQFHDWWLDGRLPIREKARTHNIRFAENTARDFLSHCYKAWGNWSTKEQCLVINLLFMHSRASSYEWPWERFIIEYMVFDGCFRLAEALHLVQKKQENRKKTRNSGKAIKSLCQSFCIPYHDDLADRIGSLRNELFHRALWDGSQPCTTESSSTFMLPNHLRRLNQRLIPALFGYKTPYVQTEWWFIRNYSFGPAGK